MAGTKMTLRRYGEEILYYHDQEIIVDVEYLAKGKGLFIALEHSYMPNTRQLDVYFNGQHLSAGGGYEEVDEHTIRLDLRDYQGNPASLREGDEIYIRIWKNNYSTGAASPVDSLRFFQLEQEVKAARGAFPWLGERLSYTDKELAHLLGEGNYTIIYQYDPDQENILREVVSGDYEIVKEYEFNDRGKPTKETIYHESKKTIRTFDYDSVTGRLVKLDSVTVTNSP